MKLSLFLLASCAMIALAFRTHQPVVPPIEKDTIKPVLEIVYARMNKFIFVAHYGDDTAKFKIPSNFRIDSCFEYWSRFGYKPCGGAWIISDTMRLINALVYDIVTINRPILDTGDIWYGSQKELIKSLHKLDRDSVRRIWRNGEPVPRVPKPSRIPYAAN